MASAPTLARSKRTPTRLLRRLSLGIAVLLTLFYCLWALPFWGFPWAGLRKGPLPRTPPWALECWLWEDDHNTAVAVEELLQGYASNDIPVRTVLIDSPWSTAYNNFQVDEARYPKPADFFGDLQARGYRVVVWMTPMVNRINKDTALRESHEFHDEAQQRGFLAGGGREIRWWKGTGSFIDYTHPEALAWWQGMQDKVLAWGIDGWKLDGTDTLFSGPGFLPFQRVHSGWMTTRAYMDMYNREEYQHGLRRNPEFIVLTRAIDNRYFPFAHPEGFAPLDAAPVTWVGDRTHEWSSKGGGAQETKDAVLQSGSILDRGFEGALRDILASARRGYCVVGDDVAGYHGREPIPPRLYIRWAQFAAFTGLFLNGGHGERRLWMRSPEELEVIRRFAWLHTELVPYMYSHVVDCSNGGAPLIRPTGEAYEYLFGDDILVAPIYRDDPFQRVHFPSGVWRPLLDLSRRFEGPATAEMRFELKEYPVFVREGAIVPLNVSRNYTGFGDTNSAGALTWLVVPKGHSEFTVLRDETADPIRLFCRADEPQQRVSLNFEGPPTPHHVRLVAATKPARILADGTPLTIRADWDYDEASHCVVIRRRPTIPRRYEIEWTPVP